MTKFALRPTVIGDDATPGGYATPRDRDDDRHKEPAAKLYGQGSERHPSGRKFPIPQSNSTSPVPRGRTMTAQAANHYAHLLHEDGAGRWERSNSSEDTVVSLQFELSHQREPSGSCSPTC